MAHPTASMLKSASKSTAFVLVPRVFCPGAYFHGVAEILERKGHIVRQVDLPSVRQHKNAHPASSADDADHVRGIIAQLLKEGNNFVLTGNSYGGFIATEAAKGLSKFSTDADKRDIVHLVYIASPLALVGVKLYELLGSGLPASANSVTTEYIPAMPAEVAGAKLFSELPVEQQIRYGALQTPQSAQAWQVS